MMRYAVRALSWGAETLWIWAARLEDIAEGVPRGAGWRRPLRELRGVLR